MAEINYKTRFVIEWGNPNEVAVEARAIAEFNPSWGSALAVVEDMIRNIPGLDETTAIRKLTIEIERKDI